MKNAKNDETRLVNRWNLILEEEMPTKEEMVSFKTRYQKEPLYLMKNAYENFMSLKNEALKHHYEVEAEDTFRTYQDQLDTIHYFIETIGEEEALKRVSPLGASEHHTGLAIDIVFYRNNQVIEGDELKKTDEDYKWVLEHLSDYGFILRYPENSFQTTGVIYEPWHIRYVGKELAQYLEKNHLLLEEYYENLKS